VTTTKTIVIACVLTWSAASPARAQTPAAGAPPATAAPAAPAAPDKPPAQEEMAPISIPSSVTTQSDFAQRLAKVCSQLAAGATSPGLPARFAAANLTGLGQACTDIGLGSELTVAELASLRRFWTDPAKIETLIKTAFPQAAATPAGTVPLTSSSAGSLESDIIEGLAKFVYDRAKQEATLYLTKQLTDNLCSEVHKLFFPSLCVALAAGDPSIPLGAMGTYLAAAARADLAQLPDRTLAYTLHEIPGKEKAPEGEALFGARLAFAYYQTVRSGRMPMDVARSMHSIRIPATVVGHNTEVLKLTAVLSELLDSVQAQQGWAAVKSLNGAVPTYYALGVFFTFEKTYTDDQAPFGPIDGNKIAKMIPVVARYLAEAAVLAERATTAKLAIGAAAPSTDRGGFNGGGGGQGGGGQGGSSDLTMHDYVITATQTLEQALESGRPILAGLGINVSPGVDKTIDDLTAVVQLGEQVMSGDSPTDLVIMAIGLLDRLTAGAVNGTPPRALTDIQQLLALIAQIAAAKSADEVATVLDAAAAPPSTYQLKYRNKMVALGAMAGISGGYETVRTNGLGWSSGAVVGAFAPIGLTASTPLGTCFHVGALVSVINLGALVSARFSEDIKTTSTTAGGTTTMTVETEPQVKFANVLAPGVFFTLGLGKSPFVFSFGGQVIPLGRQVTTVAPDGTTSTSSTPAVQLLGALSVDVPIFPF
jgi:hypothetical protein